jgi:hypothetical protein
MGEIIDWIKRNKLASFLIIVVVFFVFKSYLIPFFFAVQPAALKIGDFAYQGSREPAAAPVGLGSADVYTFPMTRNVAPVESEERLVVEESSMSLVVSDVSQAVDKVVDHAKGLGGFMVSSSLNQPEETPYATVVVRIPSDKLRETLEYYRGLAIKVTSERLVGTDVTSEYEDLGAKIAVHEKTKVKFESILESATEVQDILQVNREIINVQRQIDSLKGRQKYLEQTAKLAKITVYLSTDEWSLPYAPTETFRPKVIFKLAVRSLVKTLRGLAEKAIWIGVYAVIWVPILLVIIFFKKWRRKKKAVTPPERASSS